MASIPEKSRVPELLKHLDAVVLQRVEALRQLADTYKMESVPYAMGADMILHIAYSGGRFDVWTKNGSRPWITMEEWGVEEKSTFVRQYDGIVSRYCDHVCLAYTSIENAVLWKGV
jgi:hypothetical protein